MVEPQYTLEAIEGDPADNRVPEFAIACEASCIVSGALHLLKLKKYSEIVVLQRAEVFTVLNLT